MQLNTTAVENWNNDLIGCMAIYLHSVWTLPAGQKFLGSVINKGKKSVTNGRIIVDDKNIYLVSEQDTYRGYTIEILWCLFIFLLIYGTCNPFFRLRH